MTDAIQKAREELRGQLALLHSLANDTTEANWRDKRLYILQTCVRMSDALAALDAETPATPADVGELVERLLHDHVQLGKMTEQASFLASGAVRVNDPSALMADLRDAATALERVVRERDEALTEHTDMMWQRRRAEERAESAKAKLAEARKVIEPFAEHARHYRNGDEEWAVGELKPGHFHVARRFLEETK